MENASTGNAATAVRAIELLGARNFDALKTLLAPDAVLHFPFHPEGEQQHRGADAIINQFVIVNVFETFAIDVTNVFDAGGDIIVEARSHGVHRKARPDYRNHYLFVLSVDEGRVVRWREFYNPLELLKQTRQAVVA